MRIASITAGAAGMFCGSCLRDNTLAAALIRNGHDCLLVPTFTPLTLDEPDQSRGPVFLGGVNVYLDEYRATRWIPRRLRGWLDRPAVLNFATRFRGLDDYEQLGELTLSMLRGTHGRQKAEFDLLIRHLATEVKPDAVLLTNLLLSGLVPLISERLGIPVVVSLQGDDIFLDALRPAHRDAALELIRANGAAAAGFLATSRYYATHMAGYIGLAPDRIKVVYPGINLRHHPEPGATRAGPPAIGYFARIDPAKGLHQLVDAVLRVPDARLRISGWLGPAHRRYLDEQLRRLAGRDVEYVPCPTVADKARFLDSVDVFCVPSVYREPKALFVLEALAHGRPVVLPDHGAFPELVKQTAGGVVVPPGDSDALAAALTRLLNDPQERARLGQAGRAAVRDRFSDDAMARSTIAALHDWGIT